MTKREAIEQLRYGGHVEGPDEFMQAYWMAVNAFEQEPSEAMAAQYQEGYKDGFKLAQEVFSREGSK